MKIKYTISIFNMYIGRLMRFCKLSMCLVVSYLAILTSASGQPSIFDNDTVTFARLKPHRYTNDVFAFDTLGVGCSGCGVGLMEVKSEKNKKIPSKNTEYDTIRQYSFVKKAGNAVYVFKTYPGIVNDMVYDISGVKPIYQFKDRNDVRYVPEFDNITTAIFDGKICYTYFGEQNQHGYLTEFVPHASIIPGSTEVINASNDTASTYNCKISVTIHPHKELFNCKFTSVNTEFGDTARISYIGDTVVRFLNKNIDCRMYCCSKFEKRFLIIDHHPENWFEVKREIKLHYFSIFVEKSSNMMVSCHTKIYKYKGAKPGILWYEEYIFPYSTDPPGLSKY